MTTAKEEKKDEINLTQPVLNFAGNAIKLTSDGHDVFLVDFMRFALGQTQSKTIDEITQKARIVEKLKNKTATFKAEEIIMLKKCFVQVFNDETTIQIIGIIAPNELK